MLADHIGERHARFDLPQGLHDLGLTELRPAHDSSLVTAVV